MLLNALHDGCLAQQPVVNMWGIAHSWTYENRVSNKKFYFFLWRETKFLLRHLETYEKVKKLNKASDAHT